MSRRSRARETALQMLFQRDLNPDIAGDTVRQQIQDRLGDEELARFCWQLFSGVMDCRAEIDTRIEQVTANWSLRRMAPTDRNIIRMAAFEMLRGDTPAKVAIDEALELAKKFGAAQSSQFVNGILDRLMPGKVETAATSADDGAAATAGNTDTLLLDAPNFDLPSRGATPVSDVDDLPVDAVKVDDDDDDDAAIRHPDPYADDDF